MKINKDIQKIIWLPVALAVVIIILAGCLFFIKTPEAKITNIKSGQELSGEILVEGEARGGWFFEAQLPIRITDEQGNVLGSSYGTALGDWQTDKMVKFSGKISYESNTIGFKSRKTCVGEEWSKANISAC